MDDTECTSSQVWPVRLSDETVFDGRSSLRNMFAIADIQKTVGKRGALGRTTSASCPGRHGPRNITTFARSYSIALWQARAVRYRRGPDPNQTRRSPVDFRNSRP